MIKEEIDQTIELLRDMLNKNSATMSVSANQFGIDESICIIRTGREVVLVNPEIIEASEETFPFHEGCLSFPNTYVKVNRHKRIVVKSDSGIEEFIYRDFDNVSNIELACVQHEIDHLNGLTMFDRKK